MALISEGTNKKKQTEEEKKKIENAIKAAVASATTPKPVSSSSSSSSKSKTTAAAADKRYGDLTLPTSSSRSPSKDIISYVPSGKDSTQVAEEHWSKKEKSQRSEEEQRRVDNQIRAIVAAPDTSSFQGRGPLLGPQALNTWRNNIVPASQAVQLSGPGANPFAVPEVQATGTLAPTVRALPSQSFEPWNPNRLDNRLESVLGGRGPLAPPVPEFQSTIDNPIIPRLKRAYSGTSTQLYHQEDIKGAMQFLADQYPLLNLDPNQRPREALAKTNAELQAMRSAGRPTDPFEQRDYDTRYTQLQSLSTKLAATSARDVAFEAVDIGSTPFREPYMEGVKKTYQLLLPEGMAASQTEAQYRKAQETLEDLKERGIYNRQTGEAWKPEEIPSTFARVSNVVGPIVSNLTEGLTQYTPGPEGLSAFQWMGRQLSDIPPEIDQRIQDSYALQSVINADPDLKIVNYLGASGVYNQGDAVADLEAAKPENVAWLRAQAAESMLMNDKLNAAMYSVMADRLEAANPRTIIDNNTNIAAEMVAGIFGDMLNLADPVIPSPATLRQGWNALQVRRMLDAEAAGQATKFFDKAVAANANEVNKALAVLADDLETSMALKKFGVYAAIPATKKGAPKALRTFDTRTLVEQLNPFARNGASMAARDIEEAWRAVIDLTRGVTDPEEIKGLIHTLANAPETVIQELGILKYGTKEQGRAHKLVRLLDTAIDDFKSLNKKTGKVSETEFLAEFKDYLESTAPRFFQSDSAFFKGLRGTRVALEYATGLRLQKAILANTWLIFRPGNWIRNAAGAYTMMVSSDTATLKAADDILDTLINGFGVIPNMRLLDTIQNVATKGAGSEIGTSGLGAAFKAISNIPYGNSPIGEQTFYTKIFGTSFLRTMNKELGYVADTVRTNLIQGGVDPALARKVAARAKEVMANGKAKDLNKILRDELASGGLRPTLAEMGVPAEAVSTKTWNILDEILGQFFSGKMDEAIAHSNIDGAFGLERLGLGKLMNDVPPTQFNPRDLETENLLKDAGLIGDVARNAGASPAQAKLETADFLKRRTAVADESVQRFMQTWGEGDFSPGAFNVALDYWADITEATRKARMAVDEINTDELAKAGPTRNWNEAKGKIDAIYQDLNNQYKLITDKHRLNLQGVRNGQPSTSKTDWWTVARTRATYDPDRYQALVSGKVPGNAEVLTKELIDQTRARTDASLIDMFDVWRKAPTAENFGLVTSAYRRYLKQGAQIEAEVRQLPNPGSAGYYKAKTFLWKQFADLQEAENWAVSKIMVMNYLRDNAAPKLTWSRPLQSVTGTAAQQVGARKYTLDMPMGNGIYRATEEGTGAVRYFKKPGATVPQTFTKPVTGVVPQEVVDTFDDLLKNIRSVSTPDKPIPATLKPTTKVPPGVSPWYELIGLDEYNAKKNPLRQILDWFSGDYSASKKGKPVDTVGDMASHITDQLDVTYHKLINSLYDPNFRQVYQPIDPKAQLYVQDAVTDSLKEYEAAKEISRRTAESVSGWAMLNFNDQRNIDSLLQLIMPFSYFWSRMWSRGAEIALTRPGLMNFYYEGQRAVDRENLQENVPRRLQGTVPNPFYEVAKNINPEWATGAAQEGATALLFNERMRSPLSAFIPFTGYLPNTFVNPDEADTEVGKRWLQIQKYTGMGVYPSWELARALLVAGNGDNSLLDDWSSGSQLWPLQALYYGGVAATGNVEGIGGYNAPWWGRMGDQWDLGRIGREMTNALVEGKVSPELAKWGNDVGYQIKNGVGPLPEEPKKARAVWEEAAKRMGFNRLSAIFGNVMLGLGIYDYPESEKQAKTITSTYNVLGADTTAMGSKAAMTQYGEQTTGLPEDVTNKDVVDVSRMGSNQYPFADSETPVPPQVNIRQPYEPPRPGVAAVDAEVGKVYDEYADKIAEVNARLDAAIEAGNKKEKNKLYDERNALYDERDAFLEENFPSRTQRGTEEYKARRAAEKEIYDRYDELFDKATGKEYKRLSAARDAELKAVAEKYPGAVTDSEIDFNALQAEKKNTRLNQPMDPMGMSLVEGQGDVTSNMSVDEKREYALNTAGDMAKTLVDQETPGLNRTDPTEFEVEVAIMVANLLNGTVPVVARSEYDEDTTVAESQADAEARAQYLMLQGAGAASALAPGSTLPSTAEQAAQQLGEATSSLGLPMPPYNELAFWDKVVEQMPEELDKLTPELVADKLGLTKAQAYFSGEGSGGGYSYSGGGGGRGRRRYYSRRRSSYRRGGGGGGRSYRRGGGGGLASAGAVPPAKVSMPRLNDFNRSLYPGQGEVPTYYPQRYPRDWMSAGQQLRPDKLSKWRAPA